VGLVMYKLGNLRVFDFFDIDIDENAGTQIFIQDKRITEVYHTDYTYDAPAFSNLDRWEERKSRLKAQILTAAGLNPMPAKCPLNARVFDKTVHDGFTVEKVAFESYEGFWVTGNLYRPVSGAWSYPAVLNAHGHWDEGRLVRSELSDIPGRCANLAKLGFIAFSYDMIGYNDSMQVPHTFGGVPKELWGMGGFAIQLWNSIRCVDFLESLDDVDAAKISCTGAKCPANAVCGVAATIKKPANNNNTPKKDFRII